MRDFRDAKTMAQTLRAALAAMGFKTTVSQSLELIAQAFGAADWNTLSAAIRAQATAVPENSSRPSTTAENVKTSGNHRLSGELNSMLHGVFAYAQGRRHEAITVEHLLLFLLDDAQASRVMKGSGINLDDLKKKLTDYIDINVKSRETDGGYTMNPTLGFGRVLQRAVFQVQAAGGAQVKSPNVLVAIFSEKEGQAVKLLSEQGVTRQEVVNYIARNSIEGDGGSADSLPST
jgi:hypothetical protein